MVEMTRYFAYGSNMSVEQMAARCPHAILIGTGMLSGYRFMINTDRYATVVREPEAMVYGILWSLTGSDETSLDRYENVPGGTYTKETIQVADLSTGNPDPAMVYIARDNRRGRPRPAYIAGVIAAARHHQFPAGYILELETWRPPAG